MSKCLRSSLSMLKLQWFPWRHFLYVMSNPIFFFSFYSLTYDNLKLLVPFIWGSFLLNSLDLLLYAVNVALFFSICFWAQSLQVFIFETLNKNYNHWNYLCLILHSLHHFPRQRRNWRKEFGFFFQYSILPSAFKSQFLVSLHVLKLLFINFSWLWQWSLKPQLLCSWFCHGHGHFLGDILIL